MSIGILPQKLLDRIEPVPPSECWVWMGAVNNHGYGSMYLNRHTQLVHRIAYESAFGPIPKGLTVDHLCRIRSCVNPAHMELVSLCENILRGNSPTAQLARRRVCPKCGGPFEPGHGARFCRHCYNARQRSYMSTYRPDHTTDRAEYMRVWRAANPDRIRAYAATQKARRTAAKSAAER